MSLKMNILRTLAVEPSGGMYQKHVKVLLQSQDILISCSFTHILSSAFAQLHIVTLFYICSCTYNNHQSLSWPVGG